MPKRYARKSTRRPRKVYRRPLRKTGPSLAKKVKAIMAREVETKQFQYESSRFAILNYNNTSPGWGNTNFGTPMTPYTGYVEIGQGTGQGSRIGNSITIRKLMFRGVIYPLAYDVTTNPAPKPQEIKFWFVSQKNLPSSIPTNFSQFFQDGNSAQSWNANLLDIIKVPNQDVFTVHKTKTFKVGYAESFGTGSNSASQYYNNTDFKLNHKFSFDLTKYCLKHVKFQDGTNTPQTRGVFLVMEAVWANGSSSAISQANEVSTMMDYQIDLRYDDA